MPDPKEPFISPEDRPALEIDLDTPITQLRVRDLRTILGGLSPGGFQVKPIHPKFEAGKTEIKEFFDKPLEIVKSIEGMSMEPSRSGLDEVIRITTGLAKKVDELTDQVTELEKRLRS